MSLRPGLGDPFFTGYVAPAGGDRHFPVNLAGRRYVIEPKNYSRTYTDDERPYVDQSPEPTEAAFNPKTTWRRGASSWHLGCGQRDFDLENNVDQRSRFRSSLNMDCWVRQEVRPLPGVTVRDFGPGLARHQGIVAATTGGWYVTFDVATYLCTNLGTPGDPLDGTLVYSSPCTHVVQVGNRVYLRFADDHVAWVLAGGTTTTMVTGTFAGLGEAIGRLFVWDHDGVLSELHPDGTLASPAVMTHPWATAGWDWTGVIDTPAGGIAWGSGPDGGSELYHLGTDDTGAVAPPTFVGSVPHGEMIHDLVYLQGLVVMGTNLGFRAGEATDAVTYGPLVEIRGGVHHLCADGRWVLFSWGDYEPDTFPSDPVAGSARYAGLGRIDLSIFTSPLVPAYAPDLMVETDAKVLGCAVDTEANEAVIVFDDATNVCRDPDRFPSTPVTIATGRIRYGVFDPKLFSSVDPRCEPLADLAAIDVDVIYDGSEGHHIGSLSGFGVQEPPEPFRLPYVPHEWAEMVFTFSSGGNPAVHAEPVLLRWLLRAVPNPRKCEEIVLPVRLFEDVTVDGDDTWHYDVASELKWLTEMCESQALLAYADGPRVTDVYINNIQAGAVRRTLANDAWQGIVVLQLKTVV